MEQKNWLIRTRSMQILGPVQKSKIIQLFKEGKIQPEDELSCGNGFWFYIREKKLVEKYLLSDQSQEFNPVSEADDVLANQMNYKEDAFIDVDAITDEVDSGNRIQNDSENQLLARAKQSKFEEIKNELDGQDIKLNFSRKSRITDIPARTSYIEIQKKGWLNDKMIYALCLIIIVFTALAYKYKEEIIQNFLKSSFIYNVSPISIAHAQTNPIIKKKAH
ncbi:hypothetical protein N9N67_01585 [Bacteriovoracaceae bacterium]|nr:hypothetical protein [Bacteriovoracaceae bacterium]